MERRINIIMNRVNKHLRTIGFLWLALIIHTPNQIKNAHADIDRLAL